MEVNKHFLIGFKYQAKSYLAQLLVKEPIARQAMGPRGERTTNAMLNGHNI